MTSAPKISVVTPSFNQGNFLSNTITSVLSQDYPTTEYIVVDGASTDGSAEILRTFSNELDWWISERDNGQSSAINKGLTRTTGEYICWLNSDDSFEPGTLRFVSDYFQANPEVDVVCGGVRIVNAAGDTLLVLKGEYQDRCRLASFWGGYSMHQPSIFWRRRVMDGIGLLNERLHLTMDFDYWLRMSARFEIRSVERVLSSATAHSGQKTADNFESYRRAQLRDVIRYFGSPLSIADWKIRYRLYRHLIKTSIKLAIGRPTLYTKRSTPGCMADIRSFYGTL